MPPSASPHAKPCTICQTPRDVLVRCQVDDSQTWHFVCPGSCWKKVSGGVIDGDGENKWYRYGGMWKNKHEGSSARMRNRVGKKGKAKEKGAKEEGKDGAEKEEGTDEEEGEDGVVVVADDG